MKILRYNLFPSQASYYSSALSQTINALTFENPLGLAAGFDKNARALHALAHQGFGFVETGTVTPKAQAGNSLPRLFRLNEDRAIINRMGFNNDGLDAFIAHLKTRPRTIPIGANIGKNKDSTDPITDYLIGLRAVYNECDYITINISSPNTPGLRALQESSALEELLSALKETRASLEEKYHARKPLWLKIAPDMDHAQEEAIANHVLKFGIDALIISNTTLARDNLKSAHAKETGGLSGRPLFEKSTAQLKRFYALTEGKITLVGIGGIDSAETAYEKIRAGASLLGIYSALIYEGFSLIPKIIEGLHTLLNRDGFSHIKEAVGTVTPIRKSNPKMP